MLLSIRLEVEEHRTVSLDRAIALAAATEAATIAVLRLPGAYAVHSGDVGRPAEGTAVLADPADA